ncbi:MAG: thiamine diphosphokinase [Actinobacteria bacterium]|nr:thiamine diphosphokinase [Actinomycetota bacterium]
MKKLKVKSFENFKKTNKKNSKAILVTNGKINDYPALSGILIKTFGYSNDDFVIAADGGAGNCINLKIFPDVIIGDMDSITASVLSRLNSTSKELEFINCSHDKDQSDTQLALDYLKSRNFKKVLVAGALGGRFDHSFANIMLLASESYEDMDISIISGSSEIFIVSGPCSIKGTEGKKISIFSLTPYVYFEKTAGLRYRLKNEKLFFSPARGLSNEFIKNTVKLYFENGKLLIVREI